MAPAARAIALVSACRSSARSRGKGSGFSAGGHEVEAAAAPFPRSASWMAVSLPPSRLTTAAGGLGASTSAARGWAQRREWKGDGLLKDAAGKDGDGMDGPQEERATEGAGRQGVVLLEGTGGEPAARGGLVATTNWATIITRVDRAEDSVPEYKGLGGVSGSSSDSCSGGEGGRGGGQGGKKEES